MQTKSFVFGFIRKFPIFFLPDIDIFTRTNILGKTAPTTLGEVPEDLIARLKLRDVFANRFHPSRYVSSDKFPP